jgi:hypothetical protein
MTLLVRSYVFQLNGLVNANLKVTDLKRGYACTFQRVKMATTLMNVATNGRVHVRIFDRLDVCRIPDWPRCHIARISL